MPINITFENVKGSILNRRKYIKDNKKKTNKWKALQSSIFVPFFHNIIFFLNPGVGMKITT
jgi:hypothetical protein